MEHKETDEKQHSVGYGIYILVWLSLVILTGFTVAASGVNLKGFAVATALLIASTKTGLVMNYFMHLRYEKPLFRWMVVICIVTLAIFIGLTFFDVLYR